MTKVTTSKKRVNIGLTCKVSKGAKIRKRYNQIRHLTQDTNGKVTNSQLRQNNSRRRKSLQASKDRPLVKSAYQKLTFLFLNQNICCGYSKEPSQ